MKIARESIWIAIIGLADLITTVLWIHYHGAAEANPVFAHYLQMGVIWFALMKLFLLAGPIFVLEWARQRRPRFTRVASRFAIGAYCGLYVIGFLRLNPDLIRPASAEAALPPQAMAHKYFRFRHPSPFGWPRSGSKQLTAQASVALLP
jgi:hypothetical protein